MSRVRISNSSINSYGTRLLTGGGDLSQYQRNSVLLYMHRRGEVMGFMKDIKTEGDEITAEPVFDEVTDQSKQLKKQWEFGSLKMVSAGIDIIEVSEDPKYLVPGQTRATITKWKLVEVSIVDIGSNDDALVLMHDGKRVELSGEGECSVLPLINNQNQKKQSRMNDLQTIALALSLSEGATLAEVTAKITTLMQAGTRITELEGENTTLKTDNASLQLSSITTLVKTAQSEKKISADKEAHFIELGKKIGIEALKSTFEAMSPAVRLSSLGGRGAAGNGSTPTEYKKLSEVPVSEVMTLRTDDPETYKRLFKAEYGYECSID
jgi:hypothetical protein